MIVAMISKTKCSISGLLVAGLVGCSPAQTDSAETLAGVDSVWTHPSFLSDSAETARVIEITQASVLEFREESGALPGGLDQVVAGWVSDSVSSLYDNWGERIVYTVESDGFEIRSAGPDRVFDTPDDLVAVWAEGR